MTTAPACNRRQMLVGAVGLLAAGCAPRRNRYSYRLLSFATTVTISLETDSAARADAALRDLRERFAVIHRDWYAWGDGELAAVNTALARGETARLSPPLTALLQRAMQLREQSDGYFDPTVGGLVKLWGFDRFDQGQPPLTPPAAAEIDAALAVREAGLTLTPDAPAADLSAAEPGLQIDLGGIAKGAALAEGIHVLNAHGIERALIEAGGDIATLGKAQGDVFQVGLRDPRANAVRQQLHVAPGESVMSSGDYARFWTIDGRRYQHIIDPQTGWPADGAQTATVVATDPLLADAAATALMVAGADAFRSLCDAMQISSALLVDNDGKALITDAMRNRMSPV